MEDVADVSDDNLALDGYPADEVVFDEAFEKTFLEPAPPVPYAKGVVIKPPIPRFTSCPRHLRRSRPSLQNIYRLDGTARIWYVLVQDPEALEHLSLTYLYDPDNFEGIGERPRWLDEEVSNDGIDFFSGWGRAYWEDWGLTSGVAPNQPFALEHEKPYVTGAYEDAEVQFDWDLAAVTPLSLEHAAARWQRYFNQKAKSLADQRAFDEKEQMIQHELTRYMYIRWDRYGDCHPGYRGISVTLRTSYNHAQPYRHFGGPELARGTSESGDKAAAWASLEAEVFKRLPRVSRDDLKRVEKLSSTGWRVRMGW